MQIVKRLLAILMISLAPAAATAEVLLTLIGTGQPRQFERAELEAMPSATFTTTTSWTEGPQTFTGVPLADFLAGLGVTSGTLRAAAVNDYAVEIPVADAVPGGPIIAYARNGKSMSVRDKGPLWIVYPYDANPDYQSEVIYSRSIWQLDRIEVRP